jgi:hypothetical protein
MKPYLFYVNNSKTNINSKTISLKKGANSIKIVYSKACETFLVVRNPKITRPERQPVSMSWYNDFGILPFDCSFKKKSSGLFVFESVPGLKSLIFAAHGNVTLWVDGVKTDLAVAKKQPDGLTNYNANMKNVTAVTSQVVLKIEYQPGYTEAGAIPQYFRQLCDKGMINLRDWSTIDGLKSYSGGAWYRKTININADDLKRQLEIDLGDLVSSAEMFINGKSAGIRLSPPWIFDITNYALAGENKIEVLIYNTLANNYTSVPTRYRGEIKSGLIGPVTLRTIDIE